MSVVFVQLNEVNFDYIKKYIGAGVSLPTFQRMMDGAGFIETMADAEYHQLEPWIQWVSINTGLKFNEHGVFRLGDIVKSQIPQLYEIIEGRGYSTGAVSPMNVRNELTRPDFFVPDPWTDTPTDGSWQSRWIASALSQGVNDNNHRGLTFDSALKLGVAVVSVCGITGLVRLARKLPWALSATWRKAIFLDILLAEIFLALHKSKLPDFSTIFLNAGAHLQHHYMHSSSVSESGGNNPEWYLRSGQDPVLEVLLIYDALLGRFASLPGAQLLVATGLTQVPCSRPHFYYRLKDHESFFKRFGMKFKQISPRMTRDFLVFFDSNSDRDKFASRLETMCLNDQQIFGEVETREKELFVTMTYDQEILPGDLVDEVDLCGAVAFVALKNGVHHPRGFVCLPESLIGRVDSTSQIPVEELNELVLNLFPDSSV